MTDPLFAATDEAKRLAKNGATHCVYRTEDGRYGVAPGNKPPKGAMLLATYGASQQRGRDSTSYLYPTRRSTR